MTIHHAVLKKAARNGVVIQEVDHNLFAVTKNSKLLAEGTKAADVLELALKALAPVKAPKAAKVAKPKKAKKAKAKKSSDEEDGEEDGEEAVSKSVITAKYKKKYRPHKDTNGDEMVDALRSYLYPDGEEMDKARFYSLAKAHGIDGHKWDDLKNRSGAWNVGMARMNLRNVLQGQRRHGKSVTIGKQVFAAVQQTPTK